MTRDTSDVLTIFEIAIQVGLKELARVQAANILPHTVLFVMACPDTGLGPILLNQ